MLATFLTTPARRMAAPDILTRNQAASQLEISVGSVDKLTGSGLFGSQISRPAVDQIKAMPSLTVLTGELTVLRTDSRKPAYAGEGRQYIGFHVDHTDAELEDASLRWWRSDPAQFISNELFVVTIATVPVATYRIHDKVDTITRDVDGFTRHRYAGDLLSRRIAGTLTPTPIPPSTPHYLGTRVEQIMSSRITVSSGGAIGYLRAAIE